MSCRWRARIVIGLLLAPACSTPEPLDLRPVVCFPVRVTDVDGTVLEVNPALGTIAIAISEHSAEVARGVRLAIYSDRHHKGEIRITEVTANMAFGQIEKVLPGQMICKGDKATTRLQ